MRNLLSLSAVFVAIFVFAALLMGVAPATWAGDKAATEATSAEPLRILVLKEHGVGSPTLAQPYLDRFVARAAEQNGWKNAKGQYYVTRAAAEEFIATQKPHYGIMSLAAFLDFRLRYNLEVVGKVDVSLVGGGQYFLISKTATTLEGCQGKKLASDHATDTRFVDRVIARGDFVLSDFELVETQRPLQTIKFVITDKAECALIDDAQFADLDKLTGGKELKTAWTSKKLPPMVVAAFPSASTEERERFQKNFDRVCDADTRPACAEVGISSLDLASAADYAAVMAAYGN